jgi:cell division protease FtsH
MKNNVIARQLLTIFILFLLVAGVFSMIQSPLERPKEIGVAALVEKINQEEVKSIDVDGDTLHIVLNDDTELTSRKEASESLSTLLDNYHVAPEKIAKANISIDDQAGLFWLAAVLPFILPFLLVGAFLWLMMRQVQGTNNRALMFGQARPREFDKKDKKNKITFRDVAGVKEAKNELEEIVQFLRHPKKFLDLGARIPRGVLLVGPPGTGKTLLARAIAGEAHVPFFHISGSEFVEMFVGVGASRVRDLFKQAKRFSPCIVFIDEIDAVGHQRGTGIGGSHDEREQTLNQILVEMDGFDNQTNIIVVAATNRPDVLDPALLRPGRFDRRVVLDLPDIAEREEILKVHTKDKPLAKDVSLRTIAEQTPGFSGADLANLLNEAAILTARRNKKEIELQDCLESIEKVMLGPERKGRVISEEEKSVIAYHEAGHALVAHVLPHVDPVRKVSIVSRGRAGGYTLKMPNEDRRLHTRSQYVGELAVMLGGHAAEMEIFHDVTTGPSSDLEQATRLAKQIVTQFGMSDDMGPRTFGERDELVFLGRSISEQKDYSEATQLRIDQEVDRFIREAYNKAKEIITHKREILDRIAKTLVDRETLNQQEFEQLVGIPANVGI